MGKREDTKAIWIEWRRPRTKTEKGLYGETVYLNEATARIFLNTDKCKKPSDNVTTFWHEMVHVFHHFYSHKPKVSDKQEEKRCRQLETVIWEFLR